MKAFGTLLAVLAVLAMVSVGFAADKPAKIKKQRTPSLRGVVVSVDGDVLIIKTKVKGEKEAKEVRVSTNADTKIKLGKDDAGLSDLKEGFHVQVTPVEGTATMIKASAPKPKKEKTDKPKKDKKRKPKNDDGDAADAIE